jgi:hypothetical protein
MKILWIRNDHVEIVSILLPPRRRRDSSSSSPSPSLLFFCCSVHTGALVFWRLESELAVAFYTIDAITLHIWASLGAMSIGRLQTTESVWLHTKWLCIKFGCCRTGRAYLGYVTIQFTLISGNHSTVWQVNVCAPRKNQNHFRKKSWCT